MISRPTPASVDPKPETKLLNVSAKGTPAISAITAEPPISDRNGCTLSATISTTMVAMPARAASIS